MSGVSLVAFTALKSTVTSLYLRTEVCPGAARIKVNLSSAQSTDENCIAVPKDSLSVDPLRLLMARAMPLNAPLVFKLVDDAF